MLVEVINGLLGAGKTTVLLNMLEQKSSNEKVAVLVNEFGEIGIDGDLLGGQGADVVELPNGCICCTLKVNLLNQIKMIAEDYHPDRLFIEPTGVATIKNLMGILKSLSLEKYIDRITTHVVVDASIFREIMTQNIGFVINQLEMAQVIIVNKCDKVSAGEIAEIREIIRNYNSTCKIVLTVHGRTVDNEIDLCNSNIGTDTGTGTYNGEHGPIYEIGGHHAHDHEHELPLKNYEQFSSSSSRLFELTELRKFFTAINNGEYGLVDRAKGIFQVSIDQWIRIDLAAHEIMEETPTNVFTTSKIMVIGTGLKKDELSSRFNKCLIITTQESGVRSQNERTDENI